MNTFKKLATLMLTVSVTLFYTSCGNIAYMGHKYGYDINTEIKPDLSAPVSANIGFESHTSVAIPPKKSLSPFKLFSIGNIAKGDVLPSISRMKISKVGSNNVSHEFITVSSTGKAASILARNKSKSNVVDTAENISEPEDER